MHSYATAVRRLRRRAPRAALRWSRHWYEGPTVVGVMVQQIIGDRVDDATRHLCPARTIEIRDGLTGDHSLQGGEARPHARGESVGQDLHHGRTSLRGGFRHLAVRRLHDRRPIGGARYDSGERDGGSAQGYLRKVLGWNRTNAKSSRYRSNEGTRLGRKPAALIPASARRPGRFAAHPCQACRWAFPALQPRGCAGVHARVDR